MKPLIIYHADCADGYGAAFAAWVKFGDEAEYLPMQYGQILQPSLYLNREVYVLDFSFLRETMDGLFEMASRVVWLDHHKTAFEMWLAGNSDFPIDNFLNKEGHSFAQYGKHRIELNNWKSGAILAWEFFHPGAEVPKLIKHIDDRDRWQFKMEGTKELHAALWSYAPWSFEQWSGWINAEEMGVDGWFKVEGAAILRAHNQNVQSSVKKAGKCTITFPRADHKDDGVSRKNIYPGLAVNCPAHLASDVGHELANQSGTFGLCWHLDSDCAVHCSLRSNGDYDVSAIAKHFGGGGHRNAAGFSTDIETLMRWLK